MLTKKHFLDKSVLDAAYLKPSSPIKKKQQDGWLWHRVNPVIGACGGTASYSRALVSPDGMQIAFLSDRTAGPEVSEIENELQITRELMPLNVPYLEKDAAKQKGAVWISYRKIWACAPSQAEEFAQWIEEGAVQFNDFEI